MDVNQPWAAKEISGMGARKQVCLVDFLRVLMSQALRKDPHETSASFVEKLSGKDEI
jgi:hypothetical protein